MSIVTSTEVNFGAQKSARRPALVRDGDLPEQFTKHWRIDKCNGVGPFGTGLNPDDFLDIVLKGTDIRIQTSVTTERVPDPRRLHDAPLVLIGPVSSGPNVLTQEQADSLCTADTKKFEPAFGAVLAAHAYSLTYLACETALHKESPRERVLIVFLPYVVEKTEKVQFVMAIVAREDLVHEHAGHALDKAAKSRKRNHNGIVHGNP